MVFLFIFLGIILLFITSKIRIEIKDVNYSYKSTRHINDNYKITTKLIIASKLPVLWSTIDKQKVEKFKQSERFKNINLKSIKEDISIKQIGISKEQIKINIKKFYLNAQVGTESTMLTTMLVPALSTIIALILAKEKTKKENLKFTINPIYNSGNILNVSFSGTFEIKTKNILTVILMLIKSNKNNKKPNGKYILKEKNAY